MKLNTTQTNIERQGTSSEQEFTIRSTAKSFEILSSGLYTDPIQAIIRELSCNAYDSHVAAGKKDTPFRIHLPNELEPFFSVTDYGVGLDHESILNIYTTYFESTKTESNDFIGALGLGSKSPFSYTTAYEVISIHNGVQNIYSIFLNEDRIPAVARMGSAPSVEGNGVQVKITVKPKDFYTFQHRTKQALSYFATKPEVVGVHNFEFDTVPKPFIEGTGWEMGVPRYSSDGRIIAVQGNVRYRVEIDNAPTCLRSHHTVLYFNIGELDVAANREEIRYDESTLAAIRARLGVVESEIVSLTIAKILKNNKTRYDIFRALNVFSTEHFGLAAMIPTPHKNPHIQAYVVSNGTFKAIHPNNNKIMAKLTDVDLASCRTIPYDFHTIRHYSLTAKSHTSRPFAPNTTVPDELKPTSGVCIIYNDANRGAVSRSVQHCANTKQRSFVLITPNAAAKKDKAGALKEYDAIVDSIGNPKIQKLSDTDPVAGSSQRKAPSIFYGMDATLKGHWRPHNQKSLIKLDLLDELPTMKNVLYFPMSGHGILLNPSESQTLPWATSLIASNITRAVRVINTHMGTDYSVENTFGVSKGSMRHINNNPEWTNLFSLLDDVIINNPDMAIFSRRKKMSSHPFKFQNYLTNQTFLDMAASLSKESPFVKEISDSIETANKLKHISEDDVDFLNTFGYDHRPMIIPETTPLFTEESFEEYPMLCLLDNISIHGRYHTDTLENNMNIISKYITDCDVQAGIK